MVIVLIKSRSKRNRQQSESIPVFCTCSSLLACSRMDLMASSEPLSVVRILVVMLPEEKNETKDLKQFFFATMECICLLNSIGKFIAIKACRGVCKHNLGRF